MFMKRIYIYRYRKNSDGKCKLKNNAAQVPESL